ncbi:MAG: tRNA (adenosine(37)-N6)-threonylcarbamoyltransferase complex ATPase subunit type 1 TsaE, partial [Betaproteobacteria bacterium]
MANLPHPQDGVAASKGDAQPEAWFYLPDAAATLAAGARMAAAIEPGMLICLVGELGTGKTTLARGALRALGWDGPVKSPTYTLVEHYLISSLYFYHFDF